MADDLKMKMQMYEAQAMLIEKIDQAIAATERKFEELRTNAEERIQQAVSEAEEKFEDKLTAILKIVEEGQQAQTKLEQSLQVCEFLGWDYTLRTMFFMIFAWFLRNLHPWSIYFFPITIEGFFLLVGAKSSKKWLLIATLFIFILYLPGKEETVDGIRQHFETKIETLQRRIDEQSGEIENLKAGQLEKAALVKKANEETKKMVENISSELGFHSLALILGGRHDSMTDSIDIFDSKENKWRRCKQKLPFKVTLHGSAILNGKIYIMGGENDLEQPLASCYKLGENGEWTKMADMNEKRTAISQSTIVFGSEIWVIGGWRGGFTLQTVEKYNPQTNIWTKMPDLNFERSASSASIIGRKIFVSGGWDGTKTLKSVEVYDPAKNKWEIFCDMPLELNAHCSIVEGTNLIIIGGEKSGGTPSDEVWKIDVFDPKKEWIKMPSLKQERYFHGAVKLSNGIMVFGGATGSTTAIDSVEIFDGISWKEGPKLPEKHGVFSTFPLSIKTEKQLLLQLC